MVPVAAADSCGRTATRSCDKMTKTTKAVNMIQDQGAIPSQRAAVIVVQKIFVALASDPHNIGATHSDGCLYSRFVEESVQSQVGLHRQKKKKRTQARQTRYSGGITNHAHALSSVQRAASNPLHQSIRQQLEKIVITFRGAYSTAHRSPRQQ